MHFVFFVGITGTEKQTVIDRNLKSVLPSGSEDKFVSYHFEDRFKEIGEDVTAWMEDPNPDIQLQVWSKAFETIVDELRRRWHEHQEPDVVFISMHCSFYRKLTFCPIDLHKLRQLAQIGNPEANTMTFVSLLNDIYDTRQKIIWRNEDDPTSSALRLREVASWRILDAVLTDIWVRELKILVKTQHFILSVKHSPQTLADLILQPSKTRIYTAFPISSTRETGDSRSAIDSYRKLLRESELVVFDPLTIDELVLEHSLSQAMPTATEVVIPGGARWEIPLSETLLNEAPRPVHFPIVLPRDEVEEVIDDVRKQIEWRDFRYIQQADCLVVYRPYWGGRPHTGVKSEMDHARHLRKRIFMYFPDEDGTIEDSPFSDFGQAYAELDEMTSQLALFRPPRIAQR